MICSNMDNTKKINITVSNQLFEIYQDMDNNSINVINILDFVKKLITKFINDPDIVTFITNYTGTDNKKINCLFDFENIIETNCFYIDSSFFLYLLKKFHTSFYKILKLSIKHYPLLVYPPVINATNDVFLHSEICDILFDVESLYVNNHVKNIVQITDKYYKILDIFGYLKYRYEKDTSDLIVCRNLYKLYAFIFKQTFGYKNVSSDLLQAEYNKDCKNTLDVFVKTNGGFFDVENFNSITNNIKNKGKKKKTTTEKETDYQKLLHNKLGGIIEVLTPVGRIDLLTNEELIEIKVFPKWKDGVGQLLSYGQYYPNHQKVLSLFGKNNGEVTKIKKVCDNLDITLRIL